MDSILQDIFINYLNMDDEIKKIINCDEFYYQKAIDKYNELINLPKLGPTTTQDLIDTVTSKKSSNSFNFIQILGSIDKKTLEYKVLYCIGELIAYIDYQAANKNTFNQYEDKRTIARSYVRQNAWVNNLLKYKEDEDINKMPGAIKNALMFIIDPINNMDVLSDAHRELIAMFVFNNKDLDTTSFSRYIIDELSKLDIHLHNNINANVVYSTLLYKSEIRKLWQSQKTIWKISHGNKIEEFKGNVRNQLLSEKKVVVNENTLKGQAENFKSKMKVGDIFYLCFSGEIKLLGIITSEATPSVWLSNGWLERSYEVIKLASNNNKYTGQNSGWAPTYNSTCMAVKEDQLKVFDKDLLGPYFDLEISELFNIDEENISIEIVPEVTEVQNYYKNLNYILYGPPGTGKTYHATSFAVAMIEKKVIEKNEHSIIMSEDYSDMKKRFETYKNKGQIVFTTFHQSYGYEEFIEGIKPCVIDSNISYKLDNGIFKDISDKASHNKHDNYVIIIDEINRGNISAIFGELITLVEKTKRIGNLEETKVTLPYSQSQFGVPNNLFILGTMNTADRSIALLDTALRRRFQFIEMMPNSDVLRKLNNNIDLYVEDINIKKMLDKINERIEILYDREHMIGHAYFNDLIEDNSIDVLADIFMNKIIPLLQEYFYDDYEKIRLVLADNQENDIQRQFITSWRIPNDTFGNIDFDYLEEKRIYTTNIQALTTADAYKKIYDKLKE